MSDRYLAVRASLDILKALDRSFRGFYFMHEENGPLGIWLNTGFLRMTANEVIQISMEGGKPVFSASDPRYDVHARRLQQTYELMPVVLPVLLPQS